MEMEIDPGGGLEDHFVDEVGPHRGNSQERDDCYRYPTKPTHDASADVSDSMRRALSVARVPGKHAHHPGFDGAPSQGVGLRRRVVEGRVRAEARHPGPSVQLFEDDHLIRLHARKVVVAVPRAVEGHGASCVREVGLSERVLGYVLALNAAGVDHGKRVLLDLAMDRLPGVVPCKVELLRLCLGTEAALDHQLARRLPRTGLAEVTVNEARVGLVEHARVLGADRVVVDDDLARSREPLDQGLDRRVVRPADLDRVAKIVDA